MQTRREMRNHAELRERTARVFSFIVAAAGIWVMIYALMSERENAATTWLSDNLPEVGQVQGSTAQTIWVYTVWICCFCAAFAYLSIYLAPSAKARLSWLPRPSHVKVWYIGYVSTIEVALVLLCGAAQSVAMYDYYMQRKARFESRGREFTTESALMAACRMFGVGLAINLLFLIPAICKHSFWLELFNVGFERAVRWHRWSGVVVILLTLLHAVLGVATYWKARSLSYCMGWTKVVPEDAYCRERLVWINIYGEIATAAAIIIMITSFETVRRWNYRIFYIAHWMFVPFFAFGAVHDRAVLLHALPGMVAYAVDKVLTAGRARRTCTVLQVLTDGDSTRLVVAMRPGCKVRGAGQWFFLNLPQVSALEWHPMSVSDVNIEASTLTFDVRHLGRWSNKLGKLVAELHEPPLVRLSGPFGGDPVSEGGVLFISGGIGITAHLLAARDAVTKSIPCKFVGLIWVSPSQSLLEAFEDKLEALRQVGVIVDVYYTARDEDVEGGATAKQVKLLHDQTNQHRGYDTDLVSHPAWKAITNLSSAFGAMFGVHYGYIFTKDESRELDFDGERGYLFFFAAVFALIGALAPVLVAVALRAFVFPPIVISPRSSFGSGISSGASEPQRAEACDEIVQEGAVFSTLTKVQRGRPDLEAKIAEAASRSAALGCPPLEIHVCGPAGLENVTFAAASPMRLDVHTEPYAF